jgi:pimeloyl-ACP methyl ester carboxylesterase
VAARIGGGARVGKRLRARVGLCVALAAFAVALGAARAAQAIDAIVLVSGFSSSQPFSSSTPACAGQEGAAFSPNVAPTLKAAGLIVFTAPEGQEANAPPPCTGGGPAPPSDTVIDTSGDLDENGGALARLIAFLRDAYGVTSVQLVGHSDGGLWSRAAIAQDSAYAGVRIQSLNTVASPHTGSFVADAAILAESIDCGAVPDRRTRQACKSLSGAARLISDLGGPTAISELTYTYMGTWAARQPFGDCPVTVFDGIAFSVPGPVSQIPRYYNPSDGVVGQASALAQASRSQAGGLIPAPGFRQVIVGGTFDAVHTDVLSFAGQPTELSLPPLANRMLTAVVDGAASTQTCNGAPPPPRANRAVKYGLALRTVLASSRSGKLPPQPAGDILSGPRTMQVRCGARSLIGDDPPGIPGFVIAPVGRCTRTITVTGGTAFLLRRDPRRRVDLTADGRRITVKIEGKPVRSFEVEAAKSTGANLSWKRLHVDGKGRARLPGRVPFSLVRVVAKAEGEQLHYASAVIAT